MPVVAIMAGSACCSSHSMVSPSDLCPNSLVNWKTLAAHTAGIRIRRPRPSTLVCRSFDGFLARVLVAAETVLVVVVVVLGFELFDDAVVWLLLLLLLCSIIFIWGFAYSIFPDAKDHI